MLFRLLALIVLLLFYGIYFTKMLIQKKQGIQTRQIGKRKEKELPNGKKLVRLDFHKC